jgi:hypothetical protein
MVSLAERPSLVRENPRWFTFTKDLNYSNRNEQTYSKNVSGAVTMTQDVSRVLPVSNIPSDQLTNMMCSPSVAVAFSNNRPKTPPVLRLSSEF